MYLLIRRIHLFTGLLLLLFVFMYFVSGYVIIHRPWFGKNAPKTSTRTETLEFNGETSEEAMAKFLQDRFDLRGRSGAIKHRPDGSVQFNFARPGTIHEAVVASEGKQVTITSKEFGFADLANGMHRLHGYKGGWLYWVWALFFDLASAALIVFALTGVVLWYQMGGNRIPGLICLLVSFGFTAAMISYLMWTK